MSNNKQRKAPFTEDFVFNKVLERNRDLAIEILKLAAGDEIAGIDLDSIVVRQQETKDPVIDAKSVRYDIYMVNDNTEMFDIEMQTTDNKNLPKRSRYYIAANDVDNIQKGTEYKDLPKTIVIFICTFDPFGLGYQKYVAKERLFVDDNYKEDVTELGNYDPGYAKIYLNSGDYKYRNTEGELYDFLRYVNTQNPNNTFTDELQKQVDIVNIRERAYIMTLLEKYDDYMEKGEKIGKEIGLKDGKLIGLKAMIQTLKPILKSFDSIYSEIEKNPDFEEFSKEEIQKIYDSF